jgi:BlaI family penicillinase repressor
MTKPKTIRLGDLQLSIMKVLWEAGEASVAHVHTALGGSDKFAYTTVATMLRKMEGRGLVAHREEGRSYLFRAKIGADAVSRSMADHLVDRLFEGSLATAVNHLLSTREVSESELREIERLVAKRRKEL